MHICNMFILHGNELRTYVKNYLEVTITSFSVPLKMFDESVG